MLGIGQATAPALLGTPEQVAAQAEQIEFVPVRTLTRVAMTRPKVQELIAALEANLSNFDRLKQQFDQGGQNDLYKPEATGRTMPIVAGSTAASERPTSMRVPIVMPSDQEYYWRFS